MRDQQVAALIDAIYDTDENGLPKPSTWPALEAAQGEGMHKRINQALEEAKRCLRKYALVE